MHNVFFMHMYVSNEIFSLLYHYLAILKTGQSSVFIKWFINNNFHLILVMVPFNFVSNSLIT